MTPCHHYYPGEMATLTRYPISVGGSQNASYTFAPDKLQLKKKKKFTYQTINSRGAQWHDTEPVLPVMDHRRRITT